MGLSKLYYCTLGRHLVKWLRGWWLFSDFLVKKNSQAFLLFPQLKFPLSPILAHFVKRTEQDLGITKAKAPRKSMGSYF